MEEQCSPLSWASYYQEEGIKELKQSLLYSTLELQSALVSAHEDISRKDDEILHLKALLANTLKERDQLHSKCLALALENQLLSQQVQILAHSPKHLLDTCPVPSTSEDEPSDSDDNINVLTPSPAGPKDALDITERVAVERPLPEKGRFLKAVMEAGPLLKNLLLAGPLPRWQHPPPQLSPIDIPPVSISSPRILAREFSSSPKYQRVCSPITIEPKT